MVGGVRNNLRIGLTARRERLLDAIALSGGSTFPIEKSFVQLTREVSTRQCLLTWSCATRSRT